MTADHHIYDGDAGHEPDFAINMAAMLRTATRAADELAGRYRELARRFADQVDDDLASDLDPSAPSVGQAFREVDQQGHQILVALHKHRTHPTRPWSSRLQPASNWRSPQDPANTVLACSCGLVTRAVHSSHWIHGRSRPGNSSKPAVAARSRCRGRQSAAEDAPHTRPNGGLRIQAVQLLGSYLTAPGRQSAASEAAAGLPDTVRAASARDIRKSGCRLNRLLGSSMRGPTWPTSGANAATGACRSGKGGRAVVPQIPGLQTRQAGGLTHDPPGRGVGAPASPLHRFLPRLDLVLAITGSSGRVYDRPD
jgi:hypothetical protein